MKQTLKQSALVTLLTTSLLTATACEGNLFGSRSPSRKPSTPPTGPTSPQETDGSIRGESIVFPTPAPTPVVTFAPGPNPDKDEPTATPVDLCPEGSKSFSVLILDLKSGWFAGDGGDFFKDFVKNDRCKDTVKLSYLHITKELVEGNVSQAELSSLLPCAANGMTNGRKEFSKNAADSTCSFGSFNGYDQLWLLGGSTIDPVDLSTSGKAFLSILQRAKELYVAKPNAGFFVGAGLRNTVHANAFVSSVLPKIIPAKKLFVNFGEDKVVFPSPDSLRSFNRASLRPGNGVTAGTFNQDESLFSGMTGVADYEKASGRTMYSVYKGKTYSAKIDPCLGNPIHALNGQPVLTVVATDHCGQPIIGRGQSGGHKVIADGNMARFYLTQPTGYFHSLILNLL